MSQRKRDMWLWNPGLLRPVVVLSTAATLVAVTACYPFMGSEACYLLFAGMAGPIIGLVYGVVGRKVRSLKASVSSEEGDIEESLIVIDKLQSPGIALLSDRRLRLIPIVGKELSLDLGEIESVREVHFFNGKSLIWKKWLVLSEKPRLGFALPEPVARRWLSAISGGGRGTDR